MRLKSILQESVLTEMPWILHQDEDGGLNVIDLQFEKLASKRDLLNQVKAVLIHHPVKTRQEIINNVISHAGVANMLKKFNMSVEELETYMKSIHESA